MEKCFVFYVVFNGFIDNYVSLGFLLPKYYVTKEIQ